MTNEDAIKILETRLNTYYCTDEDLKALDMAIESLKDDWIPVKTRPLTEEEKEEYPNYSYMYDCRMPEDGEEVLITTKYGVDTDIFCRDADGSYFECCCDDGEVLAWKRFPQPYKEGDQNEND